MIVRDVLTTASVLAVDYKCCIILHVLITFYEINKPNRIDRQFYNCVPQIYTSLIMYVHCKDIENQ